MGDADDKHQNFVRHDRIHDHIVFAGMDASKVWVTFQLAGRLAVWILTEEIDPAGNALLYMLRQGFELILGLSRQLDRMRHIKFRVGV